MVNEAKKFEEEDKKTEQKINAKNSFDSYIYQIKNQIEDPDKLANKVSEEDKATVKEALKEAEDWLSANQGAEKEEFEEQQKKLEGVCSPIIQQAYGGQAPPPGGDGQGEYENPEDL